jgi:predicted transcriptional regulator
MGASKTQQFSEKQLDSERIGKAIASAARIAILQHINKYTATTNKELTSVLSLSQTSVHQHIRVLVKTGFLEGDFFGNTHAYYFKPGSESDLDKIRWILSSDTY